MRAQAFAYSGALVSRSAGEFVSPEEADSWASRFRQMFNEQVIVARATEAIMALEAATTSAVLEMRTGFDPHRAARVIEALESAVITARAAQGGVVLFRIWNRISGIMQAALTAAGDEIRHLRVELLAFQASCEHNAGRDCDESKMFPDVVIVYTCRKCLQEELVNTHEICRNWRNYD